MSFDRITPHLAPRRLEQLAMAQANREGGRNDQRGGIGVKQLRLQQHVVAEAQPADQVAVFEPPDANVEIGAQVVRFCRRNRILPTEVIAQLARRSQWPTTFLYL